MLLQKKNWTMKRAYSQTFSIRNPNLQTLEIKKNFRLKKKLIKILEIFDNKTSNQNILIWKGCKVSGATILGSGDTLWPANQVMDCYLHK